MSLINEALKKAQTERQTSAAGDAAIDLTQATPPVHHQPPRRRGYLWGFILALLLVGLFSSILATFFVWQILGPDEKPAPAAQIVQAAPETQAPPTVAMNPAPAIQAPVSTPEATAPLAVEEVPAPEPVAVVEQTAVAMPPEPPAPAAQPEPVAAVPGKASPPDAAVRTRLQELEIRGIMSGGTRVLIFDTSTNRAKAYRPGEIVEGPLALTISAISQSIIEFEDYAGSKYTKSF